MTPAHFLRKMAEYTLDASPDELLVLATIAERMHQGRLEYGPLNIAADDRDWEREAANEASDLLVYRTVTKLARRASAETLPPPVDDRAVAVGRGELKTIPEVGR